MGVAILACLVIIALTIALRAGGSPASLDITAVIPAEGRVLETRLDGDRLAVRLETREGQQILLYDAVTGAPLGTIRLERAGTAVAGPGAIGSGTMGGTMP